MQKCVGAFLIPPHLFPRRIPHDLIDKKTKGNKAVLQLSLKGEVLNRFHSMKEAERVTGIYSSGIIACVNGIQRTACGFKWAAE